LSNDRKVLLFNVIADNPYLIHYYLADNTIDIREVNFPNNGRDPFPLMLKRYNIEFNNIKGRNYTKNFHLTNQGKCFKKII
jgi:hypothetical protein